MAVGESLDPPERDAMPSVRALAGHFLLNPMTVSRALQALGDDGFAEVMTGARAVPS